MTSFNELYKYIRIFLNDTNTTFKKYSDDLLNSAIELTLMNNEYYDYLSTDITPDLADDSDKLLIILYSALNLLQSRETFSYKTPNLTVQRSSKEKLELINSIKNKIEQIESGEVTLEPQISVESDTYITNVIDYWNRYTTEINE